MAEELNVFLDNRPGRLRSVAGVLAENHINVRTMTMQDRGQYGLMRLIVDKPEQARHALAEAGFACALKEIVAIEVTDKPGSFLRVAEHFELQGINIIDAYGFVLESNKKAVFCMEVKDAKRVKKDLITAGFHVLEKELCEF